MKNKKTIENRKRLACYLLVAFFALVLASTGFVLARYSYQEGSQGSVQSNEFYFTSNLLDGKTHTLAPGSTQVTFSLENHADDLRFSQVDISYTVKVNGATPSGDHVTGTLEKGDVNEQKVVVSGLTPGQSYEITAEGVGGYHKTLRATIVVPPKDAALYKYLESSGQGYVLLTVWSKGVSGEVTVTPPNTVVPDNTDEVMRSAITGTAFTDNTSFSTSSYGSHVYRFFGSGVSVDDFLVKCGEDITAVEKAPN